MIYGLEHCTPGTKLTCSRAFSLSRSSSALARATTLLFVPLSLLPLSKVIPTSSCSRSRRLSSCLSSSPSARPSTFQVSTLRATEGRGRTHVRAGRMCGAALAVFEVCSGEKSKQQSNRCPRTLCETTVSTSSIKNHGIIEKELARDTLARVGPMRYARATPPLLPPEPPRESACAREIFTGVFGCSARDDVLPRGRQLSSID